MGATWTTWTGQYGDGDVRALRIDSGSEVILPIDSQNFVPGGWTKLAMAWSSRLTGAVAGNLTGCRLFYGLCSGTGKGFKNASAHAIGMFSNSTVADTTMTDATTNVSYSSFSVARNGGSISAGGGNVWFIPTSDADQGMMLFISRSGTTYTITRYSVFDILHCELKLIKAMVSQRLNGTGTTTVMSNYMTERGFFSTIGSATANLTVDEATNGNLTALNFYWQCTGQPNVKLELSPIALTVEG